MFISKDNFFAWLDEYTRGKRNDLQRSQTAIPKRSEKIILDLTAAPLQPIQINTPFKSVTFVKSTDQSGYIKYEAEVKVILDSQNTGNEKNAVTLKTYDTFNQDQTISRCFLTWVSQPGVFAELVFLEDSQLYSGFSKVQITDSIPLLVAQDSYPWNCDVNTIYSIVRIAENPIKTEPFDVLPGGVQNWTVPDNEYWHLNLSVHVAAGGLSGNMIRLNGTLIAWPQEKGFYAWEWDSIIAGDFIEILADPSGTGIQGFFAKYQGS